MKKFESLFTIMFVLFIISCGTDDENTPTPDEETLSFSSLTQEVNTEAGQVIFDANLDLATYSATSNADWITVNKGATTITADYEENPDTTPRTGTITISGNTISDITLTINQEAGEEKSVLYGITDNSAQPATFTLINLNRKDGSLDLSIELSLTSRVSTWISNQNDNVAYATSLDSLFILNLGDNKIARYLLSTPIASVYSSDNDNITLGKSNNIYSLSDKNELISIDVSSGAVSSLLTLDLNDRRFSTKLIEDKSSDLLYVFWRHQEGEPNYIDHNFITTVNLSDNTSKTEEFTDLLGQQGFYYASKGNEIYRFNFNSESYVLNKIDLSTLQSAEVATIKYQAPSNYNSHGIKDMIYDALLNQFVIAPGGKNGSSNKAIVIYDFNTGSFSITDVPEENIAFRYDAFFIGK